MRNTGIEIGLYTLGDMVQIRLQEKQSVLDKE